MVECISAYLESKTPPSSFTAWAPLATDVIKLKIEASLDLISMGEEMIFAQEVI